MKPLPTKEVIRPSSLVTFADCAKRAVASTFPVLVTSKGYALNSEETGIAAIMGHALHAGAQAMCEGSSVKQAQAKAFNALLQEIEDTGGVHEALFDKTTPNIANARAQLERMVASYANACVAATAHKLESRLEATIQGRVIAGSPDRVTSEGKLIDIKTGQYKQHAVQIGAYALLLEAQEAPTVVTAAEIHYVRRSTNVTQPPLYVEAVDLNIAKPAAERLILRFGDTLDKFTSTGDKWDVPENPSSSLCQRRYCTAWGTDFCSTWYKYPSAVDRKRQAMQDETT